MLRNVLQAFVECDPVAARMVVKYDDTVDDLTMSPTDAEELLAGLEIPGWDSTVQADMISPNWQQKADAVTLIGEKIAVSE